MIFSQKKTVREFISSHTIKMRTVFLFALIFISTSFLYGISPATDVFLRRLEMCQTDVYKPISVFNYMKSMTIEEKIGQLFLLNLEGNSKFTEKTEYNDGIAPGGYLLFSYNIADSKEKVQNFTKSVNDFYVSKNQVPPFLSIDHEGGYVNRLKKLYGNFLSQEDVANKLTEEQAYQDYFLQGKILNELGIHINLAPIVEEKTVENQDFLDNRSFGSLEKVLSYGEVCVKSYIDAGIIPVLKHFPGNTNDDPHLGLPKLQVTREEFEKMIIPFDKIISSTSFGYNFAIILSHAMLPNVFGEIPACFSKEMVTDILKKELNFTGLIISDDIYMGALAKNGFSPEKSAELSILSGVDLIMLSPKRFVNLIPYLKKLASSNEEFNNRIEESCAKILSAKIQQGLVKIEKIENPSSVYFESQGFPKMYDYSLRF